MKKSMSLLLTVMLLIGCAAVAQAENSYAMVDGTTTLNLRAQPNVQSTWLGRAAQGDWVEILSTESNGWSYCRIVSSGLYGYMSGNYLNLGASVGEGGTVGVVKNPVATQFLNLRQSPSLDAPVLGIYYNGAACTVLATIDGWYFVSIDGKQGFFRSEFIQINGGKSGVAVVRTGNSGKLNLRSAPRSDASVLAQYANGTSVTVLLKGNTYWKVQVEGRTGYMESRFLTENGGNNTVVNPTAAPKTQGYVVVNNARATAYLNLRAQPSTAAKVLAQYKNGIRLEVIEAGETWCKVYGRASGNVGYVMTRFVTLHGVSASPQKTVRNGNTYVNLRSAPSKATGSVYKRVNSGETVTVLTPGDEWTQVRYGNTTGYMMTCFLK